MKSAYELAMERLGGETSYSEEQKQAMSEIDRRYDAKKAEAELGADQALKGAETNPDEQEQIRKGLANDLRKIEEKREAEKEAIREG